MRTVVLLLMVCVTTMAAAQKYKDPSLSARERAEDLCAQLTLEEKAQLMLDESPAIRASASRSSSGGARPSTALPIWVMSPTSQNP